MKSLLSILALLVLASCNDGEPGGVVYGPKMYNAARDMKPEDCVSMNTVTGAITGGHVWSKWSAPEWTSDWFTGAKFYQTRTCEVCGVAESRVVQVSASAR